jgi:hypothetical protein
MVQRYRLQRSVRWNGHTLTSAFPCVHLGPALELQGIMLAACHAAAPGMEQRTSGLPRLLLEVHVDSLTVLVRAAWQQG